MKGGDIEDKTDIFAGWSGCGRLNRPMHGENVTPSTTNVIRRVPGSKAGAGTNGNSGKTPFFINYAGFKSMRRGERWGLHGYPPGGKAHPADPQAGLGPVAVRKMPDKTFRTPVYFCVKNIFCLAARMGEFF